MSFMILVISKFRLGHLKVSLCMRSTFIFISGFRLPNTKCMVLVDMWKHLQHSNIVQLREVFTTKAFGDYCEYVYRL
jgi:hypothetical protein